MNYLRILGVPCAFFLLGITLSIAGLHYNNYIFYIIIFVGLVIYYIGKEDGKNDALHAISEAGDQA